MSTHRPQILSRRGMVVTPHPLATQVGLQTLQEGGTAIDAAIAANAVLGVVLPHMCGIGGDAFFLIHPAGGRRVVALNASGRAPRAARREVITGRGHAEMPHRGILSVTVPGAVDGWQTAHERFGRRPFASLLGPAIAAAEEGFPVTEELSDWIARSADLLGESPDATRVFYPQGRPPRLGESLRQKELARTLRVVAEGGRDAFYRGEIARSLVAYSEAQGGLFTPEDFAEHRSGWAEPVSVKYRGHQVYQCPPNSQGIATLIALNILEGFDLKTLWNRPAERLHLLVEAKKLAFADRDRYVSDPAFAPVPAEMLLSPEYAEMRRRLIDRRRAMTGLATGTLDGDTIALCTVDAEGTWVALIQSIFSGFGAGIVGGDTGIVLHNRGAYFSLRPDHVNRLEPAKRTLHTLTPCLVLREGKAVLALGTRGADGQPQTLLSILSNLFDGGLPIQEAIDEPRWVHGRRILGEKTDDLRVEARIRPETRRALSLKGHRVRVVQPFDAIMGFAQGIWRDPETGTIQGGADPRGDSLALGD